MAGQTLVPGASAITISNTPLSLAPGGTQVVVGNSTIALTGSSRTATPTNSVFNGAAVLMRQADKWLGAVVIGVLSTFLFWISG